ncbi:MAG: Stf0 family sulfotransferase [Acidimicrobiales bacterium]
MSGYLLCGSPRSGSTLLCDLLAQSGVAGMPESYFRPASILEYSMDWGVECGTDGWGRSYIDSVRHHGEAGTGCFGMRIMWSDMPAFLERLAVLDPAPSSDRERLRSQFGIDYFVRLSRNDKVAQAVSLVIAAQTGLWHRNADGTVRQGSEPTAPPCYDYGHIAAELEMLECEARGWDNWFSTQSIAPLELTYEALSLDPVAQVMSVLSHIGSESDIVPTVGTARLATSLTDEWTDRFRASLD